MAKGLPEIEVKETFKNRRLRVPSRLDSQIVHFTEFYEQQTGTKPDENVAIVAIVREYLSSHSQFQQFLKGKGKAADADSKKKARA